MHLPVSLIAILCSCGAAVQALKLINGTEGSKPCWDGDKLYFIHVMKDGGSSVDSWFKCLGEKALYFSIKHSEGGNTRTNGLEACPESVCAAHRGAVEKTEVCGRSFAAAQSMTVLREPVSRVFSLYIYNKYHKNVQWLNTKDHEGNEKTFLWLMQQILNGKENPKVAGELANAMAMKYFAPNPLTVFLAHGEKSLQMFESNYVATSADLSAAKRILRNIDTIFFTDELENFVVAYEKTKLPFAKEIAALAKKDPKFNTKTCPLKRNNVADCTDCAKEPTQKEYELAKRANSLDIELYEYARSLESAIAS